MKSSFKNSVLLESRLHTIEAKLLPYAHGIQDLYRGKTLGTPEASVCIAGNKKYQGEIEKALKRFKYVDHVLLIGIGGSSLGTEAVYQALRNEKSPTLTVLDEIDGESLVRLKKLVEEYDPLRFVTVIVSKSGTTTETIVNTARALEVLEKHHRAVYEQQLIFVGDEGTPLMKEAQERDILTFSIPKDIGGRYSVFTAAGIVPLTLLGIDVKGLRKGAESIMTGPSLRKIRTGAAVLALHALDGFHTVNFFTFNMRLEYCGFWYRQLLAESIGKNMTTRGSSFSHQLLPIVSTKVDLHSMAQLFLSGYKGIYTHFVHYVDHPYAVLKPSWLFRELPFLARKEVGEVNEAILTGVRRSYNDRKLPYRETILDGCTAFEIGALLNSLMVEVMFVAHALHVNAFDQPHVESYKKHTRAVLR